MSGKMFQQFLEMKTLHLLHYKIIYLLENVLNWAKPERGTTQAGYGPEWRTAVFQTLDPRMKKGAPLDKAG